jgi:HD domain
MSDLSRSSFIASCAAATASFSANDLIPSIAGITVPNTALTREATSIAQVTEPYEIFNHSRRVFLFAELLAKRTNRTHDVEAVYVASLLHDVGLTSRYMTDTERFEVDGANVARALLQRHNISKDRADVIWDAIALHDQGGIARWKQDEVALVNAGVTADFGGYLELLDPTQIRDVLATAPRGGFVPAFLSAVAVVARRKPQATGNSFVVDVGARMIPGFHLANFCDEVQVDPFARYM